MYEFNDFSSFCGTMGWTIQYFLAFFVLSNVYVSIAKNLLELFHNHFWLHWKWFLWKNCQITCSSLIVASAWLLLTAWMKKYMFVKWFVIWFPICVDMHLKFNLMSRKSTSFRFDFYVSIGSHICYISKMMIIFLVLFVSYLL